MAKFSEGTFRGVKFYVGEVSGKFGHRTVVHEYPQKDIPATDRLGRQAQKYNVSGFFLGDDLREITQALISAYQNGEPGLLDHPTFGQIMVVPVEDGLDINESSGTRRRVTFTASFSEAGEDITPSSRENHEYLIKSSSDDLLSASKASFADTFSVLGKADFVVTSATGKIDSITDDIGKSAFGRSTSYNNAAAFFNSIRNLKAEAASLARDPSKLADRLNDLNRMAGEALGTPSKSTVSLYQKQFNTGSTDTYSKVETQNRVQENQNKKALNLYMQETALANAAIAAATVPFESTQAAEEVRDALVAQIEKLSDEPSSDAVFLALMDLKSRILGGLPKEDQQLANVTRYVTKSITNPFLISYELFGSIASAEDIISRNTLRNPSFISANTPLEVLSDFRRN